MIASWLAYLHDLQAYIKSKNNNSNKMSIFEKSKSKTVKGH